MYTEDDRINLRNDNISCLVSCQNGVYSMQKLLEWYSDNIIIDQETKDIILAGPDHEDYLECDIDDLHFKSICTKNYNQEYILFWREGNICCYDASLDSEVIDAMFEDDF